jgi:alcohol dehydrogenase class IV
VALVHELCSKLSVPSLSSYGLAPDDFPAAIDKTVVSSSMKGNPIVLTREEMQEILTLAL